MKRILLRSFAKWVGAEALLFAVFVFTDSAAAISLFFAFVLIPAASWLCCFFVRKHISASAALPSSAKKSDIINGNLRVSNSSGFPAPRLFCVLTAENHLTGEKSEIAVSLSVGGKKTSEAEFSFSAKHCGYATVKIDKIYLTDIFGFVPLRVKSFRAAEAKATVLPDTFAPVVVFDSSPLTPEDSDSYSNERKGNDYSETFQLREYVEGDSLKQVHWKLSEKIDKLIVRDASLPIAKSTLIFWDKSAGEKASPEEMDCMAEVVSSVAQALCRMGIEYTLGWNDGKAIRMEEVDSTEKLITAIPKMIKEGSGEGGVSGAESFIEANGAAAFGKIIYAAKEPSPKFEDFAGESGAFLLLCGGTYQGRSFATFHPESYTKDLDMLELTT